MESVGGDAPSRLADPAVPASQQQPLRWRAMHVSLHRLRNQHREGSHDALCPPRRHDRQPDLSNVRLDVKEWLCTRPRLVQSDTDVDGV